MKQSLLNRIRHFFDEDVWDIPEDPAKPIQSFFIGDEELKALQDRYHSLAESVKQKLNQGLSDVDTPETKNAKISKNKET
jgi:hypothetical protein